MLFSPKSYVFYCASPLFIVYTTSLKKQVILGVEEENMLMPAYFKLL